MEKYSQLTDENLVALSRTNDSAALSELSERYLRVAKAMGRKFSSPALESDDLAQEGMLGFLSALCSYSENSGATFSTYANRCMKNRIISAVRKLSSKKRIPEGVLLSLEDVPDELLNCKTPEDMLIAEKEAEYFSEIIENVLSKQESLVLKFFLTGLSYEEIAKKALLSPKAVDSTLQRARKKLRERLKTKDMP